MWSHSLLGIRANHCMWRSPLFDLQALKRKVDDISKKLVILGDLLRSSRVCLPPLSLSSSLPIFSLSYYLLLSLSLSLALSLSLSLSLLSLPHSSILLVPLHTVVSRCVAGTALHCSRLKVLCTLLACSKDPCSFILHIKAGLQYDISTHYVTLCWNFRTNETIQFSAKIS